MRLCASRTDFRGKKDLFFWIISTRMAPVVAVMVPLYAIFRSAGLVGTLPGLILAYTTFNLPFAIWILKGFFDNVPYAIEEARCATAAPACRRSAGSCRWWRPGIGAFLVLCILFAWNDFLFASIIGSGGAKTLPVATKELVQPQNIQWGSIMAAGVVTTLPMMFLGLLIRRYLVTGLTMGAVQGIGRVRGAVNSTSVWKYYGKTAAVKDLNLDCHDGEFLAILGPSGCGKSSTLRMLAGLEHISAGDISFGGQRVNDLPPKDRDIAMVFENYALYPHKTVFENMANPLRLRGMDARDDQAQGRQGRGDPGDRASCWIASRASSPAARSSAPRSAEPSCASPSCSCSTSRSPIWTPSCGPTCAASSRSCSASSAPPWSTSPTISSRPCRWPTGSRSCMTACCSSSARRARSTTIPVNEWVAGFVGEPPMNFLDCVLEERAGQLHVVHPAFAIPFPPAAGPIERPRDRRARSVWRCARPRSPSSRRGLTAQ